MELERRLAPLRRALSLADDGPGGVSLMDERPAEEGRAAAPSSKLRHELRTPIHQILGYSELLQEEMEAVGQAGFVPDLQKIQGAARRLLELIDHLFTASGSRPAITEKAPEIGEMTGFKLRAIRDVAPMPEPAVKEAAGEPGAGNDTILVVDDNELNRDMLSRRLEGRGYRVAVAEDGEAALRRIAAEPFDAVLLDVIMPGLSGLDVLKTIRERYAMADLPVIMATAKDDSEDIVEALKLGANDYVTKPLDFPVVLARVKTQLSLKRAKERVQRLAEELELRNRFIRKTFGRYLSDEVVASLLESSEGLKLGGESRVVTILMSDLRGFTSVAERLAPEQVVTILNHYLGAMAEVITQYKGTIDEFIGDAILAIFGAPVEGTDDAPRAVACALAMQKAIEKVNATNAQEGLPRIEMGIAVNTGEVVVGNIGSEARAKYGIVGSHVNLTARIESHSVGGQVLISDSTLQAAGDVVKVGRRLEVHAKGFREPITAHEVHAVGGPYGISLDTVEPPLVALPRELPIRYAIVDEKTVDEIERAAALRSLSPRKALVAASESVPPLKNIRLRLVGDGGRVLPGDVYAKVLETRDTPEGSLLEIRFTSVPEEISARLSALVRAS